MTRYTASRLLTGAVLSVCLEQARAQMLGGGGAPDIQPVRVIVALVLCLAIGVAIIYWLRRRLSPKAATDDRSSLRLIQSLRLDARRTLFVVDFEKQRILLAADGSRVARVGSAERADSYNAAPDGGGH